MGKRAGRGLGRGPFTSADIQKAILLDGWFQAPHGRHPNFKHATRPGKIQVPNNWTGVKVSSDPFKGIMRQGGYTKEELLRLLNGLPASPDA